VRGRVARAASLLFLATLSILSTGFGGGEAIQVKLDEPFELRIGEKASVAGGEVTLTFLAVPQDSRCPKGEQCIVAGKAVVSLEVAPRDGAAVTVEIDTTAESEEMNISGFQIAFLGLSPYPVTRRPITSQDYLLKLRIHRL
jgi:hypothetical protein